MANQDTSNRSYAYKRMSQETQKRRKMLLPVVAALFVGAMVMQGQIDPLAKQFHPESTNVAYAGGLNNEFMLLPLLGFREAAAGLLWVRCDEFFHSGDYDAILPLVRMITWLDPHADNVFVTGAWHLAYNFTDSSERSDWRYIGPAQRLLDEGIQNNMNIPDIKFEKGWQNYDKIKDYPVAAKAFQMAIDGPHGDGKGVKGTDDYPYAAPLKTLHILAHCYERMGRIPEALATWEQARKRTETQMTMGVRAGKETEDNSLKQMQAAEMHNYQETLQRYYNRYTAIKHDQVNPSKYPEVVEPPPASKNQTPRPWDVALTGQIDVVRPHVLKISGVFNAGPDGARVNVWISDWNYKPKGLGETLNSFDVDQDTTILHDSISVRGQKFSREMDMSKDPKMYSFVSDSHKIVLDYNARQSSPHLLDRFGWSGEGITDSNPAHVYLDKALGSMGTKMIEGQDGVGPVWDGVTMPWGQFGQPLRLIRITYKVSRDQMEGKKPITNADIVPNL